MGYRVRQCSASPAHNKVILKATFGGLDTPLAHSTFFFHMAVDIQCLMAILQLGRQLCENQFNKKKFTMFIGKKSN